MWAGDRHALHVLLVKRGCPALCEAFRQEGKWQPGGLKGLE